MMKSWADHCSSDEESLDDLAEELEAQKLSQAVPPSTPPPASVEVADAEPLPEVDSAAPAAVAPPAERTYEFPDKPPFTAFIGNLAYSLTEPEDLKTEMMKCGEDVLGQKINILGARISFTRDGKHRGFGYLEVETLDQLKALMDLNGKDITIAGRKVQLDTATGNQNKRRSSNQRHNHGDSNTDGSRFRGGKYNYRNGSGTSDGPPLQRTSLKLAPRTKKAEENGNDRPASSDIFGGAKARDAQAWEQRQKLGKQGMGNNNRKGESDRRRSPQAGRGRSGRGGGKDDSNNKDSSSGNSGKRGPRRQSQQQNVISPEEKAAAAVAKTSSEPVAVAPAAPKANAPPANKFALLMDSDSE